MAANLYDGNDFSQYQSLRQVLAPQYAILPSGQIRKIMEANFGPGSAEAYDQYMEFGFGDIGKAFTSAAKDVGNAVVKAAPVAATIGGGALKGALAGAQYGPAGILAGAAMGGAGAGLSKYGGGTAQKIGGVLSGVTGAASQLSPLGRFGSMVEPVIGGLAGGGRGGMSGAAVNALGGIMNAATGGLGGGIGGMLGGQAMQALGGGLGRGMQGGSGNALGGFLGGGAGGPAGALTNLFGGTKAIDQFMSLARRPEMGMALGALGLGPIGRSSIPVGSAQTPIPTAALASLFSQLADQIVTEAAEWSGDSESELAYMMDMNGEFVGDPAYARDRASRVWDLLNEAQAERFLEYIAAMPSRETEFAEAELGFTQQAEAYTQAMDEAYYDALDLADVDAYERESVGESETYSESPEWEVFDVR
ncbi:hypothetical protein C2L64_44965 [Paraburkholderia hospita]|uniref:Uncharacterized protein n=1 Tax=Paraburkholderia hospita TaxID=169430 RepID=A0AAN1MQD7_9BURK|nr:hypothetical protein [Paraburkholderia hospita]AUT75534.1 hypothetical protein C2L64_44965 [Paraburkholderia hospita]